MERTEANSARHETTEAEWDDFYADLAAMEADMTAT
jgi:hypothetical protein